MCKQLIIGSIIIDMSHANIYIYMLHIHVNEIVQS